MICDSCGAGYKLSEHYCPYCQSENPVMAEIRKEQILKGYDVEAERMKDKVWAENLQKWTKRIGVVVMAIAIVAVVLAIGAAVIGPVMAEGEAAIVRGHVEKLEKYYQAQEWEAMQEYLWDECSGSRSYEKYEQVADAYMELAYFRRELAQMLELRNTEAGSYYDNLEDELLDTTKGIFTHAIYGMQDTRKGKNDRVILGNEDVLQRFYDELVGTMATYDIEEETLLEFMHYEVVLNEDEQILELRERFVKSFLEK